jgi:Domain of unknown function (DUF4755)
MVLAWILIILSVIIFIALNGLVTLIAFPIAYLGYLQWKKASAADAARGPNVRGFDEEFIKSADYAHTFKKTAIAVDVKNQRVYLAQNGKSKIYEFADIRSWRYNLSSGGAVYGGGMAVAAANIANSNQNVNSSGFFVRVKDVDHPEWQVQFKYNKQYEQELKRWMEIFEQKVNNN